MISLAYITKNEEKYIERSIKSAQSIAGETVIVDAFSEDDTVEICKRLGAKITQFSWKHDFSHARNMAISRCSGDWILMIDADEHLESEDLNLLVHAINNSSIDNIVAWQLPRKNHYPIHDSDSPFYTAPFFPDFQTRLFKNIPGIYFSGAVHEGIQQSIEANNLGQVGRVAVFLHHHMFRGDKNRYEKEKGDYYNSIVTGEIHAKNSASC